MRILGLILGGAFFLASPVIADPIQIGTVGVVNADGSENFDAYASRDRFSGTLASGITISTVGGVGASLSNVNICNNSSLGVTGAYLYQGILGAPTGCYVNQGSEDAVSIMFGALIDELSWVGFVAGGTQVSFIRLLNGTVVATDQVAGFRSGTFFLGGTSFDQLIVTERTGKNWTGMDSLRWSYATPVSEPGTLALLSMGLAGIGLMRRRKT